MVRVQLELGRQQPVYFRVRQWAKPTHVSRLRQNSVSEHCRLPLDHHLAVGLRSESMALDLAPIADHVVGRPLCVTLSTGRTRRYVNHQFPHDNRRAAQSHNDIKISLYQD